VVVICPKCKIRLKVDEGKLKEEGSRFKCPKCSTFLLVKKPAILPKKAIDKNKVLIAHSNPAIIDEAISILTKSGYQIITSSDGIDAMVKAVNGLPFLAMVEVSLPKIFGFEICKRLKSRAETKEMKFILVSSIYDKKRYKREPVSLYDADDYIEEHSISEHLLEKINALRYIKAEEKEKKVEKQPPEPIMEKMEQKAEPPPQIKPEAIAERPPVEERIERAKRLARAIMSDIYLYNSAKVEESIRNNNFYYAFAAEIKEGLKLYENRIAQEVRAQGDFFREAIENFIASKKKGM
jgi:response regulator RpfG family c-di-GMP phosphodiesterase